MSKENNLTDFLTDVADAIREKKGTAEKINPQNFSDEIKGIKTSSSMWTGHVDVEGLKAIGWDDEDIAYYQEHGVNWNEEDDEYYKVSDDNKALYGVLTVDNIKEYKDRIVWLPKIDLSKQVSLRYFLQDFIYMRGIPNLDLRKVTDTTAMFQYCYNLTTVPQLNMPNCVNLNSMFGNCYSLLNVNIICGKTPLSGGAFTSLVISCYQLKSVHLTLQNELFGAYTFSGCYSLVELDVNHPVVLLNASFNNCISLEIFPDVDLLNTPITKDISNAFNRCVSLKKINIYNLDRNIRVVESFMIFKESVLFMINNEAATEAITISLHKDAYARLATDPDIVAALAEHPLVSLASA